MAHMSCTFFYLHRIIVAIAILFNLANPAWLGYTRSPMLASFIPSPIGSTFYQSEGYSVPNNQYSSSFHSFQNTGPTYSDGPLSAVVELQEGKYIIFEIYSLWVFTSFCKWPVFIWFLWPSRCFDLYF